MTMPGCLIPDGAMQRYRTAFGQWHVEQPLGPIWNITDHGYGAVAQSLQEWLANPAQSTINQTAFETIFEEIQTLRRVGRIYVPSAPDGRAFFLNRRLQPKCCTHIYGDGGRYCEAPSILFWPNGGPGIKYDRFVTGGVSCAGSTLKHLQLQASGNGTQPRIAGASYATGSVIRSTAPTRGEHDTSRVGPYHLYLVTTGGYASTDPDPTASWPRKEGETFTDGTLSLVCLVAGGLWTLSTILAEDVLISGFYGDQWLNYANATSDVTAEHRGVADDCLYIACGGFQSAHVGSGAYFNAGDSNTCVTLNFSAENNAGYGLEDESFLGNCHIQPHTEANVKGSYCINGASLDLGANVGTTLLLNPYSESDQLPGRLEYPAISIGGQNGAGWTTSSTGMDLSVSHLTNLAPIRTHYPSGHRVLEVSFGDGANALKPKALGLTVKSEDLHTIYDDTGLVYSVADTFYAPKGFWQIMWAADYGSAALGWTGKEASVGLGFAWIPRVLLLGGQAQTGLGTLENWRWSSEWKGGQRGVNDFLFGSDLKVGYSNQVRRDWLMERCIRNGRGANTVWVPSLSVPFAGFVVVPSHDNGHAYQANGSGVAGTSEPTWPTTAGGTVTDGTITWTEVGASALWREYGSVGGHIKKDVTGLSTLTVGQLDPVFLTESIELIGTPSADLQLILPALNGYERWIYNHTDHAVTVKTAAGAGPTIASGAAAYVGSGDGTNILRRSQDLSP